MRPLIHVGYVKTGSTWLQTRLFWARDGVFVPALDRATLVDRLIRPSRLYYDDSLMKVDLERRLDSADRRGAIPLVSHERLSGAPISGGYDAYELAERLYGLMPNARVLIVIREQRSHLISIYQEYVNQGGACSLERFLHTHNRVRFPSFDWRYLCYHFLISRYQELFGADSVHVLPFELLKRSSVGFVTSLADFLHARLPCSLDPGVIRRSKSLWRVPLDRRLNFLFFRTDINPAAPFHWPSVRKVSRLMEVVTETRGENWLRNRYRRYIDNVMPNDIAISNRRTEHIVHQDLRKLGYAHATRRLD